MARFALTSDPNYCKYSGPGQWAHHNIPTEDLMEFHIRENEREQADALGSATKLAKMRASLNMLTHQHWQAHYGDDDVKASEIRCEIEELQCEIGALDTNRKEHGDDYGKVS